MLRGVELAEHAAKDLQGDEVGAGDLHLHPRVARQVLRAHGGEHQRQAVHAHRAFAQHASLKRVEPLLRQIAQRPVAFQRRLVGGVGLVGVFERFDDGVQQRVARLERRLQQRGLAEAGASDELALVEQIDIAPQRRGAPRILRHAQALVRRGFEAHAGAQIGAETALAAVDAGHAQLGEPAAPGGVGQNHQLRNDGVQRRAASARLDANRGGFGAALQAVDAEGVVHSSCALGFAAHLFAPALELLRECPQPRQLFGVGVALRGRVGRQGFLGDQGVELIVAQIAGHAHLLHAGFEFGSLEVVADGAVQRQRGAIAAGLQGEGLHQGVGQHGDLVARHIHGGQAVARELLPVGIARQRQRRGGDMNAQPHPAIVQPLQRKRIVDLGGGRVVDAERRSGGQRQRVVERRHRQRREGRALGKAFQQKALHVKRPRRGDGPGVAQ